MSAHYTPFGEWSAVSMSDGPAFTGTAYFGALSLQYNRARFYSPRLGRFLNEDPKGFADGPNMFAYVGNNPIRWVDPFGFDKKRNINVIHNGQEITKRTPKEQVKAALDDAIKRCMSRRHIEALRGILRVVTRGGRLAVGGWIDPEAIWMDWQRMTKKCEKCTYMDQLCADLEEAGNPRAILTPMGVLTNPCRTRMDKM